MVPPSATDPGITTALEDHFVSVKVARPLKNKLFVFLPGSFRDPDEYKGIVRKASEMDYHAIGLNYPNSTPVNTLCTPTNDSTCHRRARLEIIDGVDRHPQINVNAANSIVNRLTKLLQYLHKTYPEQNWQQYLKKDTPDWSKIIISGHSLGSSNAAVMGKFYPVKKVIMFSGIDYISNEIIPDWEHIPGNNEKYVSLFNPRDELIDYTNVRHFWEILGMTNYGAIINVDSVSSPYSGSHTLITTIDPRVTYPDKYHNCTAVDAYIPVDNSGKYVLDKTWEYLIGK